MTSLIAWDTAPAQVAPGGLQKWPGKSVELEPTWNPTAKQNKQKQPSVSLGKVQGGQQQSNGASSWSKGGGGGAVGVPQSPQLPSLFKQAGPRGMYVWDNTIPGDLKATGALVDFCEDHAIVRVFIECSPVGYLDPGAVARYHDFIESLKAEGIAVYALNGYAWFTVSPTAGLPGQPTSWLEGWDLYQNVASSGLGFAGVVDDSAPYGVHYSLGGGVVDHFWSDPQTSAQDYLDYLRGVKQRIGTLELVHTIPFWFDLDPMLNLKLDGSTVPQPLNAYVQGIVDTANVLAYRDQALGNAGIISLCAGEAKQGPIWISVETKDLGSALAYTTFHEESLNSMESSLFLTWLAYLKHPSFAGLAIHDYANYRSK